MIDTPQQARLVFEAVILRGVHCRAHGNGCVPGCPDCLTGDQAAACGIEHERVELGVIADEPISPETGFGVGLEIQSRRGLRKIFDRIANG